MRRRFPDAQFAFTWAFEILDVWRAGKGFDPDPDHLGAGGTGVMGRIHLAMDVEQIADKYDPGIYRQRPPIDRRKSWFALWYIDQPEYSRWSPSRKKLMNKMLLAFAQELKDKGIADK